MKSAFLYSLIVVCCAQPALAQIESDEQWQQEAYKQMQGANRAGQMQKAPPGGQTQHANPAVQMHTANRAMQPPKNLNALVQQAMNRPNMGGLSMPVHRSGLSGYGYRPSRGTVRSGYGYRPQRSQLMPAGYSQEMLQQKIQHLQQMQQQMSMGGGSPQQQQQGKPNILQMLMGGGGQPPQQQQQQQQAPNMLQMLMGGGTPPSQQQQQQPGQGQFNRRELMKNFFGGDSNSEQTGE